MSLAAMEDTAERFTTGKSVTSSDYVRGIVVVCCSMLQCGDLQ